MPHLLLLHQQFPPLFLPHCLPLSTNNHSPSLTLRTTSSATNTLIPNHTHAARSTIKCMANPRRVKMVAKQIQRELSDMLLTDTVLQHAILPEAALGADRYLSSLTTISDVEVSADLQVVKVYVSVFGDERGRDVAIAGLKSKAKYVRSVLGKRMKLRLTPEIRFIEDESLERGSRVIEILDRLKKEKNKGEDQSEMPSKESDMSEEDRDLDVDDPDEGIIYVN